MQIRATVKWRQSLPLTRAAANHPRVPAPPTVHWTPEGVSASRSLPGHPPSLLRSSRSWFSHPGRGGDGIVTPSREGGNTQPSRRFGSLVYRVCAESYPPVYIHIYAPRFHWKILVPLEEPRHAHSFTPDATQPHETDRRRHRRLRCHFGIPDSYEDTVEKRKRVLYNSRPAPRATKMVVKTLYRFIFPSGNEPGLRAHIRDPWSSTKTELWVAIRGI